MPQIEYDRSPLSPWEVFQNVYARSQVCFFLDSPQYAPPDQVYSYIGMDPELEITLHQNLLKIQGAVRETHPARELFPVLKKILRKYRLSSPNPHSFFTGGFVGFWGYELAPYCDKIRLRSKKGTTVPDLHLGLFRQVISYDHQKKIYALVSYKGHPEKLKTYFEKSPKPALKPFALKRFRSQMPQRQFERMVKTAKDYIAAGDIYQANLSQQFSFEFSGSSLEVYGKLRAINPSPFSCFMKIRDLEIVSSSPERLLRKKGKICETRPIAGTCPAGAGRRPEVWRKKLLQNEKEKAEHLMLVDLERNDLGRVCDYRSVRVEEFMVLEKYSHVVHIVSKIIGKLKAGKDAFDLIRAMFPGGTITGCPKIRCMEIIDELEPVRRGIYTGSIGYLDFYGDLDLNIVIRTLVLKKNQGYLQVGAGIVHDSNPTKEYQETLYKAQALLKALGSKGI